MRQIEKSVMLQTLDNLWKEHLAAMDYLRQGIHLRGYAQKNPKQEYKRESFELFSRMLEQLKFNVMGILSRVEVRTEAEAQALEHHHHNHLPQNLEFQHAEMNAMANVAEVEPGFENESVVTGITPIIRKEPKVGRNDPCPCGSGKKYKQCHGRL